MAYKIKNKIHRATRDRFKDTVHRTPAGNISYPSSAAAVVFGVHLSARATYRLDRKSPTIRPCVQLPTLAATVRRKKIIE